MDYLIYIIRCDNQTFQDMSTFFSLTQIELSTADYNFVTMLYEQLNQVFQVQ